MNRTGLVLAAHGWPDDPAVMARLAECAARLRERALFDEVATACHRGGTPFDRVLDEMGADEITVVPVMTSAGYYSDIVLPRELARNRRYGAVRLRLTEPVGASVEMVEVVGRRVAELAAWFSLDLERAGVAVVGHGTPRHPGSRRATEHLVEGLARRAIGNHIEAFFLDETPGVEAIPAAFDERAVIVIPFLIGQGHHAANDIPRRLGWPASGPVDWPIVAEMNGQMIVIDSAIGMHDAMVDVIAAVAQRNRAMSSRERPRVDSPANRPSRELQRRPRAGQTLRLGTRASALARWQAEHVAARLRSRDVSIEVVEMSTLGDRQLDRPIWDLPSAAPFVDDIEQALLSGHIDLAVHSLKDMPLTPTAGLALSAVLERGDVGEALVSFGGVPLAELPRGTAVGTSSARRAAQLLAVRPDLRTVPLRGAVDDRVRQVRRGELAAAILAVAGLQRLELLDEISERLPLEEFLPAAGQAAMVIQVRADDERAVVATAGLDHLFTRLATAAELAFEREFESCTDLVTAVHAEADAGRIRLRGRVLSRDGRTRWEASAEGTGPADTAARTVSVVRGQMPVAEVVW